MISTKGRYALRIMLDLVEQNKDTYIPLEEISARQGVSKKYLEIIAKSLVTGGLLKGHRGKSGGYMLTRDPSEYNVGEILELTEGSLAMVSCVKDENPHCMHKDECRTYPMWEKLDKIIHDFFYSITLEDIIQDRLRKT